MRTTLRFSICLGLMLLSFSALAGEAQSPLEGQPAVRHRYELRKNRFELGLSTAFSLNRFMRHSILVGGKLEYHIIDWFSLGGDFGYGLAMDTGLSDKLALGYASAKDQWENLKKRFSDIQFAGDVRASLTPFTGKLSLFGKLFMNYDFYGFGGAALAMTKNSGTSSDFGEDDVDAANEGFRIGGAFGLGTHLFFNNVFSMGFEIRDLVFSDNESGGDLNRGTDGKINAKGKALVDGADQKLSSHFFAGVNFTVYLPPKVDVSP